MRVELSKADVTAQVLMLLLLDDWHDLHEDIIFDLGLIGDPNAVDVILKAANISFEYLLEGAISTNSSANVPMHWPE